MTFTVFRVHTRPHTVGITCLRTGGRRPTRGSGHPSPPPARARGFGADCGPGRRRAGREGAELGARWRSTLHLPQGGCSAAGKSSPAPRAQPRAPARGTTIPFSLGDSLCSTPAQCGGQCRYKGLFCPGADARERGRVAGAAVWDLGRR